MEIIVGKQPRVERVPQSEIGSEYGNIRRKCFQTKQLASSNRATKANTGPRRNIAPEPRNTRRMDVRFRHLAGVAGNLRPTS